MGTLGPSIELRIVVTSTRPRRLGPVVADWVRNHAPTDGFAVEVIDLADLALPLLDEPEMPSTGIYRHGHTLRWKAIVGGADAIVIETMADLAEAQAALRACMAACDLPVGVSFSFDSGKDKNRTMMGVTPAQAWKMAHENGASFIGANCGIGIDAYVKIARELAACGSALPLWIKGNAGRPEMEADGSVHYRAGPEVFAQGGRRGLRFAAVHVVVVGVALAVAAGKVHAPALVVAALRFLALVALVGWRRGDGLRRRQYGAGRAGGEGAGVPRLVPFQQRVFLQGLVDFGVEFQRGQLQEPDRLLQLRRQRQMLGNPELKSLPHVLVF